MDGVYVLYPPWYGMICWFTFHPRKSELSLGSDPFCAKIMRSACMRLFAGAAIGIACAQAFRQDAAHTTLAESRWASWIWFVEDRSWPYFPPCALDYTFVYCQSGVRVVGAYLDRDLRVVGDRCKAASGS